MSRQQTNQPLTISVIVPVLNGEKVLPRCLAAIQTQTYAPLEFIVVDDGSSDASSSLAKAAGARLMKTEGRQGPAKARNLGAAGSGADILMFVDADVSLHQDVLDRFASRFSENLDWAAVFGSYDSQPVDPHFISQYKNLFHHFVHQQAAGPAATFWAGCGAVRRTAFEACGGFAEGYGRPSIEDIELGMRLRGAGYRILLDPQIQATHAKRWTLRNLVQTDLFDRAIPWTRLVLARRMPATLNLKPSQKLCGIAAVLAVTNVATGLLFRSGALSILGLLLVFAIIGVNARFYRFFRRERGWWFAVRVVPMHLIYYLYSVFGFAVGTVQHRLHMFKSSR